MNNKINHKQQVQLNPKQLHLVQILKDLVIIQFNLYQDVLLKLEQIKVFLVM